MATTQVRIGLVGIGNCASSFVQGLSFYRTLSDNAPPAGLMNANAGGYAISDMQISSAFDVHADKVGRDLSQAIFSPPNNTRRFAAVAETGVRVRRGPVLDGVGRYIAPDIPISRAREADVAAVLRESRTEVLVSYLPVGAQQASEYYAERALEAGCAFVNCIPVFIASDAGWRRKFERAGLPLVGDDVKSQVGATIVHRMLATLFRERGVRLDRTYQLNFGGNTDFKNMLERDRLHSKKISKTRAVTSQLEAPLADEDIHVGPSDFVPWLADRKFAYIRMEGTAFGGAPLALEMKLEVWDSPNSAGVVVDAVRCAKLGLDRGVGGALLGPSAYYMKSPPQQLTDEEARRRTVEFLRNGRDTA